VRRATNLLPRTFQARLFLAFFGVVAIALALVLAALPRLLENYFAQQEEANLRSRAAAMAPLLAAQLRGELASADGGPQPLVRLTDPPVISPAARAALGEANDSEGFVHRLAALIAKSDVEVRISPPDVPGVVLYRLPVTVGDEVASPGQRRDVWQVDHNFLFIDPYGQQWQMTLRLSNPYTYRAETLETVVGVMFVAAALALTVAVAASVLLATRLTTPIRRLTQASRALAEGDLGARVNAPPSGAPEITELAAAFNRMADRLQGSIEFIRRDRDRSRDFLADVSHELRTPIAALRTFNELLREGAADEPATRDEFLESSSQQIDRLDWLATNLLELSKLDSGLVALDLRPDDLRAVVESAVQQAEPTARRKQVGLKAELPGEPVRQRHDPQRLGQVLTNLIGNAVKFTPAGGQVIVGLRGTVAGAEMWVRDTGVGIDPDELPRVFERFYRGAKVSEMRAAGSGLGLSIVRSIVEMHGGQVTISSRPGDGTLVTVLLPSDAVTSRNDVADSSPAPARP
jgi:signal transduction histidine kinase